MNAYIITCNATKIFERAWPYWNHTNKETKYLWNQQCRESELQQLLWEQLETPSFNVTWTKNTKEPPLQALRQWTLQFINERQKAWRATCCSDADSVSQAHFVATWRPVSEQKRCGSHAHRFDKACWWAAQLRREPLVPRKDIPAHNWRN